MKRRDFLLSASAALVGVQASAAKAQNDAAPLRHAASARGLIYGCAVKSPLLDSDSRYRAALAKEAGMLVQEYELKREVTQRTQEGYDFAGADKMAQFARVNGQKLRGHTMVWYHANPPWLVEKMKSEPNERLMTDYIAVAGNRYRGQMHSWDVVNEAIEPDHGHAQGFRVKCPWFGAFGPRFIDIAFHAARAADPQAMLFLCDYGVEHVARWNEKRRVAILKLIEGLKSRNVPIDAFGIQGHLKPYREKFSEEVYARFLNDLKGFGIKLMVTELDCADRGGPQDPAKRDAEIGALTRAFADVSLANSAMLGILTWGISDRYSWLSSYPDYKWPDGQFSRGLPLDSEYNRKPMWKALSESFSKASAR